MKNLRLDLETSSFFDTAYENNIMQMKKVIFKIFFVRMGT